MAKTPPKDAPEKAPPADAWQPIATAPLDGRDLLLVVLPGGRLFIGWYGDRHGIKCWLADDRRIEPTHWQPLPPLPTTA
jgi:hypothetical protein